MGSEYLDAGTYLCKLTLHVLSLIGFMIPFYLNIEIILPVMTLERAAVKHLHVVIIPGYDLQRYYQCTGAVRHRKDKDEALLLFIEPYGPLIP